MNLTRISIMLCGAAPTLALSIAASPPAFKKLTHAGLKNFAPASSELLRDQAVFAHDLKNLRRDLRRGSNPAIVTYDRHAAQEDWMNIITDRHPNADSHTWLIELARRRSTSAVQRM